MSTEMAVMNGYLSATVKGHFEKRRKAWSTLVPIQHTGQPNLDGWRKLASMFIGGRLGTLETERSVIQ